MPEFHINRKIRARYLLDDALFKTDGNLILANFSASRDFAQKINSLHDPDFPENGIRPGDVYAVGLIDEINHHIITLYKDEKNPAFFQQLLLDLDKRFSPDLVDHLLLTFIEEFPPSGVYRQLLDASAYLRASENNIPHREAVLEELLLTWIANANPAYRPLSALFDDRMLKKFRQFDRILAFIQVCIRNQPGFGPKNLDLLQFLCAPMQAVPNSIQGQLEYIRTEWGFLLGDYLLRILSSLDLLKEEAKFSFPGPGPVEIPLYGLTQPGMMETVHYSRDTDWMPNLVLIAKNSYVWLYQLSIQYNRPIRFLSDIPDEELQRLAQRGINGLWLIGLWERSRASARIKQLCGNPEAISSAYALQDYRIADDLGGDLAYQDLDRRARLCGIRLASDMVPNHMAIDSDWVMDHPDWFISLPNSPFPSYRFSGPDLSARPDISIYIDDHYYDRSDAAVVFKRVDRRSGAEQYIYHGNDGTSFPWNDTAQLNYLNPQAREAVIQTILHVAKKFHIIRFDAAMTLARKHFHRLWFPSPGSGGDIPSRAEHAMSDEEFSRAMPNEFWREVVDRISVEAPDTLLLAEAFWLMESYFVRSLGMHRVYNSAFMVLLRDEENAKYRSLMKNTLEFDPEILKRYVNFLNNPDERTAIDQFGNGDKYFGVCTLMITLPGLPMFGHGQIEGFTEKYGMEYRQAYRDEKPETWFVQRHEKQIFPLAKKRYLFANVAHFLMYDFFTPQGTVDENVFAYSNRADQQVSLVIYNNRYESTRGWVRTSVSFIDRSVEDNTLVQKSLAEGLGILPDPLVFTIFSDQVTGLEFIRRNSDIAAQGMFFDLNGYQTHVFLNFRQVADPDGSWEELYIELAGRGTDSMDDAYVNLRLKPVLEPLRQIFNKEFFRNILDNVSAGLTRVNSDLLRETEQKLVDLQNGFQRWIGHTEPDLRFVERTLCRFSAAFSLLQLKSSLPERTARILHPVLTGLDALLLERGNCRQMLLFAWVFLHDLGGFKNADRPIEALEDWFDSLRLGNLLNDFLKDFGLSGDDQRGMTLEWLRWLLVQPGLPQDLKVSASAGWVRSRFIHPWAVRPLNINRFESIEYFSKEGFEKYLCWIKAFDFLEMLSHPAQSWSSAIEIMLRKHAFTERLEQMALQAGYQTEKFLSLLESSPE